MYSDYHVYACLNVCCTILAFFCYLLLSSDYDVSACLNLFEHVCYSYLTCLNMYAIVIYQSVLVFLLRTYAINHTRVLTRVLDMIYGSLFHPSIPRRL